MLLRLFAGSFINLFFNDRRNDFYDEIDDNFQQKEEGQTKIYKVHGIFQARVLEWVAID